GHAAADLYRRRARGPRPCAGILHPCDAGRWPERHRHRRGYQARHRAGGGKAAAGQDRGAAMTESETRAGFVALLGEPNAGKSTLLNRMVGAKVSIVTHNVQTTRARVRGAALDAPGQVVFVDTPGMLRAR